MSLDLCAYLHAAGDLGPQLYLSRPSLAEMDATEAFNLFSALRDTLEDEHDGDEIILLGGYLALAVTTRGRHSRGLHVIGRRDLSLEEPERELSVKLCRSFGRATHTLESAPDRPRIVAVARARGRRARRRPHPRRGGRPDRRGGSHRNRGGSLRAARRRARGHRRGRSELEARRGDRGRDRDRARRARAALRRARSQRPRRSLCGTGSDPLQATATATLDAASRLAELSA